MSDESGVKVAYRRLRAARWLLEAFRDGGLTADDALALRRRYEKSGQSGSHSTALRAVEAWLREMENL